MGVTGLETAFAALYTDLVLPGRDRRSSSLVERMTCGGEPFGIEPPRLEAGAAANVALIDPDAHLDRRRGRLREPLLQQLLRRPRADRPGADDGRRRPGRLPPAQLRPRSGLVSAASSSAERDDAGRRRRPGGLPQGDPGLRAGRRRRPRRWSRAPRRSASRSWSPSSTRRAWGRPCPRWPSTCRRASSRSRRSASRRRRPRASTSAAATRRSSAGSRPTSASTRPSSTCSTPGSRSRSPRDAVGSRTEENKRVGLHKMERAGAVLTSVETALFELLGGAGTDEFKRSRG